MDRLRLLCTAAGTSHPSQSLGGWEGECEKKRKKKKEERKGQTSSMVEKDFLDSRFLRAQFVTSDFGEKAWSTDRIAIVSIAFIVPVQQTPRGKKKKKKKKSEFHFSLSFFFEDGCRARLLCPRRW